MLPPIAVWKPTVTGILPLWEPRPGGPYELIARDLTTDVLTFATNLDESISNTSTRAPDQPAGEETGTGDWIVLANRHTEQMLIYNCAFQNSKGDGLHLQGEEINQVRFVTCHHCTFVNCKRGGIIGQRNTAWVDIHHCYVENVTDQALDMETSPSGNAQAPIGWKITHNVFKKVSGNASLLVGTDGLGTRDTQFGPYHRGGPTRDHVFAHNTVFGGSVRFFKAWNIQIHNNRIFGRDDGIGASFDTLRVQSSENVSIRDNIITRPSGSTDSGGCIGIRTDSGGGIGNTENEGTWPSICKGIIIAGNHLYQYRPSPIVDIDAADGVVVDGNHLFFFHSGSATNVGIQVVPNGETPNSGVTVNNIDVRGNVIHGGAASGSLLAAVQVKSVGSPNSSVGKVSVTNNAGEGFGTGAYFAGPPSGGGYTAQPVCYGNWWTATGVSDKVDAGVPGLILTTIGSSGYAVGPFQLIYDHTAATTSRLTKLFKVPPGRTLQIEQMDYYNETGLVADATNYFAIEIVKRARLVTAINPTGGVETLTMIGHGFTDGDGPVFIVSDGTVQANAVETKQYWVHVIDADTISLAVSRANALAGTPRVNFTGTGGGATHWVMTKVSRRTTQSGGTKPDGWAAAGSTIPADTFVTATMTTVDADKRFLAGTDVYLFLDERGTATLPAGRVGTLRTVRMNAVYTMTLTCWAVLCLCTSERRL